MSDEKRFFVDDRSGCVAVRDRTLVDPEHQGLHGDEEDCVKFWTKRRLRVQCDHCLQFHDEWVPDDHLAEAQALANKLNADD